ncbi:amidohydrolase [Rhizorhapis sp. SPR117]|uniref:amidohydrolase n=1 Tax=Rhizorhapis sp. SPR117 TaxID=2912611 RepID=UPI001F1F3042|nr:amidohydrolase family protein [Rhizorhapis sp. SPR117]
MRHPLRIPKGWLAVLAALTLPTPLLASGLIDNVNGFTLDAKGKVQRFEGLLIDDHGKVEKLLQHKDKRPEKLDFKTDGKGRTLMPGLIDAHGHVMALGFQALTLDLSGTHSLVEALAKVAAYAQAYPARRWIIGTGWDQEDWGLKEFPTAAEIDAVLPSTPVWLQHAGGHVGWANSKAMELAGVSATTKSPEGGRIEMHHGAPSGIFVDAAQSLIEKVVPTPLPKERDLALAKAQQKLLSLGVTTITDMGTSLDDWQAFRRAGDRGKLGIRILSYAAGIDTLLNTAGSEPTPWLYDDRLRMVGVELLLDGALGSRGAWLNAPYADAPGQSGLSLMTTAQLRNQMSRAAMDGFQVAVHAVGDKANAELLDAIDELAQTYTGDRRWRIEHAQIVDPADLPRFAQHGIVASMQPVQAASNRRMAQTRMGEEKLGGAYAWRSILDNGVPLAFGSDVPVETANPFPGIAVAMTREDASGEPFGGWQPEQRISLEDALQAYTVGGAYAAFAEDRLGTLTPGKDADFVIMDSDISIAAPADIRAASIRETWVGGKPQFVRKDGAAPDKRSER